MLEGDYSIHMVLQSSQQTNLLKMSWNYQSLSLRFCDRCDRLWIDWSYYYSLTLDTIQSWVLQHELQNEGQKLYSFQRDDFF